MTFDQLEVLEKIVEKGSFKAAAAALRRTQPTLSVSIKKLEAEFELTLFNRDEYRPKLTDEGRVFYEWAKQALASFRKVEVVGKELGLKKAEPRLTVVIDPVARFDTIALIFSECLSEMKATELVLRSEIFSVGAALLRRGEADFAITPKVDDLDDLESYPVERVDMLPVIARTRVAGPMTPAWLREQPQIIVTADESLGVLEGGKRCYVSDHALKRRLIEDGYGWGRLARHELSSGLVQLPAPVAASFVLDLHVMRNVQRPMGPVARSLWTRLKAQRPKDVRV